MASEIIVQQENTTQTPIVVVQEFNEQMVTSVRIKGDKTGPQMGDVELEIGDLSGIPYYNPALSATNMNEALDEIVSRLVDLEKYVYGESK